MNQRMTDRVPREQRAFTHNQPATTNELLRQLRLTETRNYDLERRNGELAVALALHAPAAAAKLAPLPSVPTRYVVITNIINLATELALGSEHDRQDLIYDLREAVDKNKNYWQHVNQERQKRIELDKKRQTARNAKKDQA